MKKRVALLNYFDGPQTSPLIGPQTSHLIGPQTSPLNGPQTSPFNGSQTSPFNGPQTSPIHTRSHFIRSFVSDKPWNENVLWLPFPPHIQTQPSTGNKTDHHNILNPTNCNQHLYIIIVIPQNKFQVHVV